MFFLVRRFPFYNFSGHDFQVSFFLSFLFIFYSKNKNNEDEKFLKTRIPWFVEGSKYRKLPGNLPSHTHTHKHLDNSRLRKISIWNEKWKRNISFTSCNSRKTMKSDLFTDIWDGILNTDATQIYEPPSIVGVMMFWLSAL